MANYATLKAAINAVIKANGNKEITGTVLNETLTAMVNSLGANYQFAGVATPSTNPGTPDQNVFYLAGQAGTYTNFNSIVLPDGVSILKWNGSWSSETVLAGDGVFDISAYKATGGTLATFADLSAALDGGNNIPSALRKGGMSVKFVQSSDNKYVQYFLTKDSWSASEGDWEKVSQLEQRIGVYSFFGYGDNSPRISENYYNLVGGKKYRLYFRNNDWVISVTANKLAMQSFSNGIQSDILVIGPNENIKKYYDITIPENSEYVRFLSRSSASIPVEILIYPIDESAQKKLTWLDDFAFTPGATISVNETIIRDGQEYRACISDYIDITSFGVIYKGEFEDIVVIMYDQSKTRLADSGWLGVNVLTKEHILSLQPTCAYVRFNFKTTEIATGSEWFLITKTGIFDGSIDDIAKLNNSIRWEMNPELTINLNKVLLADGVTVAASNNRAYFSEYIKISDFGSLYSGYFEDIVAILYDSGKNLLINSGWFHKTIVSQKDLFELNASAVYVRFCLDTKGKSLNEKSYWYLATKANILEGEDNAGKDIFANYMQQQFPISDTVHETLCQCPSVLYSDGYMFIGYYASKTNKREAPTDNTILCRVAKVNICNRDDAQFVDVLKCGDVVGNFQQSETYPPYDPQLIDFGGSFRYLMVACPNGETDRRYVARTIDKESLSMENTITPLTFTYTAGGNTYNVEMKTTDLNIFIDRIMGRTEGISRNGSYPILSNIEFYDGYFYSWLGGLQSSDGTGYMGCLIRSANGIDWELVTCPTQFSSITICWEAAITIRNGLVYVFWRFANAPRAYYNISTGVWSDLKTTLANYSESRNFLFRKGNYIYGFANVQSTITTPAGNVLRTEMAVLKFNTDFNILWKKTIQSDFGLVYPVILLISAGEYLVCASNRRWDYGESPLPGYPCSEISSILINGLMD